MGPIGGMGPTGENWSYRCEWVMHVRMGPTGVNGSYMYE